jgi:hypothetical protein
MGRVRCHPAALRGRLRGLMCPPGSAHHVANRSPQRVTVTSPGEVSIAVIGALTRSYVRGRLTLGRHPKVDLGVESGRCH